MTEARTLITWPEWRWMLLLGLLVLAVASAPYLLAWSRETHERAFSGCILLPEDCFAYLAKMRQGADGAWLFHIPYTPAEHPGALLYPLHLLLGKAASLLPGHDLTMKLVVVYHIARLVFGLGLLAAVYRFLAAFTRSVPTRRLAWMMVALGGGLGWLLAVLRQTRWLGDVPLDLYFPEGFAFIALSGFPHVAAAQSLLLIGILCLLRAWSTGAAPDDGQCPANGLATPMVGRLPPVVASLLTGHSDRAPHLTSVMWAALTGLIWLLMGLIVPFYVLVAWALAGAAWFARCLRLRPLSRPNACATCSREALMASVAALISMPVVVYGVWVLTSDPVYGAWAAQAQILSPHPLHYLAAYGSPLILAAFAAKAAWHDEGWAWVALSWLAVVPLLVNLPVSLQLRLITGAQVPLSLLAAKGAMRLWRSGGIGQWLALSLLLPAAFTSIFLVISSSAWVFSRPSPSFRHTAEVLAMDWLAARARPGDAILSAYDTGAYLPARVHARALVGHDLEATNAHEMSELVARFFDEASHGSWRQEFLRVHGVDYIFFGPAERAVGAFDPSTAPYLQQVHRVGAHAVFETEPCQLGR